MAFPVTFLVEWVVAPGFGLIFLSQKGRVTRAASALFFILATPLVFSNQYFLLFNEAGGTITEVTFKPYPTPIIQILFLVHVSLVAMAAEFLFDDLDRYGFEGGAKIGRKRTK